MRDQDGVKYSESLPVPDQMKAWVLGDPDELKLIDKPVPVPGRAEALVQIDAVAICATDLEVISYGTPAIFEGGPPFNKNFTPGHEYMGTIAALGPGVDEFEIGDRVTVEIHAGCGQCKRCRMGMYHSAPFALTTTGVNFDGHPVANLKLINPRPKRRNRAHVFMARRKVLVEWRAAFENCGCAVADHL